MCDTHALNCLNQMNKVRYCAQLTDAEKPAALVALFKRMCKDKCVHGATALLPAIPNTNRYSDLLEFACEHGTVDIVKMVYLFKLENHSQSMIAMNILEVLDAACKYNNMEVFNWARPIAKNVLTDKEYQSSMDDWMEVACTYGHLELAKLVYNERLQLPVLDPLPTLNTCMIMAGEYGHVHVLDWLVEFRPPVLEGNTYFIMMCMSGQLKSVQWYVERYPVEVEEMARMLRYVGENGLVDVVQWLYEKCADSISTEAVIQVMQFASSKSGNESQRLEMVKWLAGKRPDFLDKLNTDNLGAWLLHACSAGHLEIVQWVYQLEAECVLEFDNDSNHYLAMFMAACNHTHINVAQWVLRVYPALDLKEVMKYWAPMYDLDVQKWLLCVCDDKNIQTDSYYSRLFLCACTNGYLETAEWVLKMRPKTVIDDSVLFCACKSKDVKMVKWVLSKNGNIDLMKEKNNVMEYVCALRLLKLALVLQEYVMDKPSEVQEKFANLFRQEFLEGLPQTTHDL